MHAYPVRKHSHTRACTLHKHLRKCAYPHTCLHIPCKHCTCTCAHTHTHTGRSTRHAASAQHPAPLGVPLPRYPVPGDRSSARPGQHVQRDVSSIAIAACALSCCRALQWGCRSPKPAAWGAPAPRRAALHWVPEDVGAGGGGVWLGQVPHTGCGPPCTTHLSAEHVPWAASRQGAPLGSPHPVALHTLLAPLLCTPCPCCAPVGACRVSGAWTPQPYVCAFRAESGLNLPQTWGAGSGTWGAGEGHCPVPGAPAKPLPCSSWVPLLGPRGEGQAAASSTQPFPAFFFFPNPAACRARPRSALAEIAVCTEIQVRSGSQHCKNAASPAASWKASRLPQAASAHPPAAPLAALLPS